MYVKRLINFFGSKQYVGTGIGTLSSNSDGIGLPTFRQMEKRRLMRNEKDLKFFIVFFVLRVNFYYFEIYE